MDGSLRHLRHALRSLWRAPLFTAVAIVSLTLAVGANTAVFTLLNALVWRAVDVRDPATLVQLTTVERRGLDSGMSWPVFQELRRRDTGLSAVLGWLWGIPVDARTSAGVTPVAIAGVSPDFYAELGVVPVAGRLLGSDDEDIDRDVAQSVAVIGWTFWQRAYGGSPSAIGQEVRLEEVPFTIVGVAPRGFKGLGHTMESDVTVPLSLLPRVAGGERPMKQGASRWIRTTGRLRRGVSIDEVTARLQGMWPELLTRTIPPAFAGAQRDDFLAIRLQVGSAARGVEPILRGRYARPLTVVFGIAGVIAAIAAVNLCVLALARAGARAHELRVRLALGAGRRRLIGQAALEGAAVGLVAAACSVVAAAVICHYVVRLIFEDYFVPVSFDVVPDARVIAVATGLSIAIAVLMRVVPEWMLSRQIALGLASAGSRTVARSGRAGRLLLAAQVALTLVLLVASTLLVRSLGQVLTLDDGVRSENVLVGYPSSKSGAYRGVEAATYYRETLTRIAALPGVEGAAFTQFMPANGALPLERAARAQTPFDEGGDVAATGTQVSPGFFATLGMPLLQGRDFSWDDNVDSRRVAILSSSLAARIFGPGAGLGEHVRVGVGRQTQDLEVVGIVADARVYDVRSANVFTAYVPSLQVPQNANWKAIVLRAPASVLPAVQRVFDAIGIESLPTVYTLDYITGRTILAERMLAMLAGYFGVLALVLAAIGIHGQMAYTVSLQRKEIGVRMALGATARRILGRVFGGGLGIGLVGTAIGLVAAIPAVGVLRSLLVEMSPYDPLAFTAAPALLLGAILIACLVPALRAMRVDPMVELRKD